MPTVSRALINRRGFTLAELLVAIAILALIMGGLLTMLMTGNESYVTGSNQVEAQGAARAALERMAMEIRGAGFIPQGGASCRAGSPAPPFNAIIGPPAGFTNPTATGFTIQNDTNADNDALDPGERISYVVNGALLQRTQSGVTDNVIGGIQTLTFTYWDENGVALPAPVANIPLICSVGITIVTQPENAPATWTAGDVRVTMTAQVRIRNR